MIGLTLTLTLTLALFLGGSACATAPALDACGVPDGSFAASLLAPSERGLRDPVVLDVYATPPTLTVTHAEGIGGVRIVRTSGRWPATLQVQFDGFKGLEGLTMVARDVDGAQVATEAPNRTGRTEVVTRDDGHVEVVAAEPFSATLGPASLPARACELQLSWIDFYRH